MGILKLYLELESIAKGFSEIAKSLNFTAEHTENAKALESLNNDWNSLKTLRTLRSPR